MAVKRVLLTGAAGFVGSHVLRHILITTDYELVCPVTFTHRGLTDRLRWVLAEDETWAPRVKVVKCDLTAPISDVTDWEFGNIDYVINVASESHVDRSIDTPTSFIVNNVALLCHLLDWCRLRQAERPFYEPAQDSSIKAILQVSTDEVYGPAPEGVDHREWGDLHLPSNPYAASKAAQEDIAFSYWRTYDLPIVITNTMNIIGQMQHPEKFVPMVIHRLMAGEEVRVHGSPEGVPGSRFYLHARNQAHGLMHVLDFVTTGNRIGDIGSYESGWRLSDQETLRHSEGGLKPFRFHIVGEREVDNLEMVRMIMDAIVRHLPREHGGISGLRYRLVDFHSSRPGHDLRYALDGSKMAAIGWKPPVPLQESLEATVRWTLDHPEWLIH